jgi:hypothetical protein
LFLARRKRLLQQELAENQVRGIAVVPPESEGPNTDGYRSAIASRLLRGNRERIAAMAAVERHLRATWLDVVRRDVAPR